MPCTLIVPDDVRAAMEIGAEEVNPIDEMALFTVSELLVIVPEMRAFDAVKNWLVTVPAVEMPEAVNGPTLETDAIVRSPDNLISLAVMNAPVSVPEDVTAVAVKGPSDLIPVVAVMEVADVIAFALNRPVTVTMMTLVTLSLCSEIGT